MMGIKNNRIKKIVGANSSFLSIINGNSIIDVTFVEQKQVIRNAMVAHRNVPKFVTSSGISRSKPPFSLQLCSIIAKDKKAMLFLNLVVNTVIDLH